MSTAAPKRVGALAAWMLVMPAVIVYAAILVLPMINLVVQSFFEFQPLVGVIATWTLDNYARFFSDSFYLNVLARTFKLALVVALLCLLIGWPVAYQLSKTSGRWRIYFTIVVLAPLLVSVVVRTFGWVVILGPNGLVNQVFVALGVGAQKLLFTEGAVILGMVHVLLPFMVISIAASLDSIDPALARAAANLGASPARTLQRVHLPLSLPGVIAGSGIVFSVSASAFVTPALLGGSGLKYMSTLIYQQNALVLNWPFGGALAVILLVIILAAVALNTWLVERRHFRGVFQQ